MQDELDKILYAKNPTGVINIKIAKEGLLAWRDKSVLEGRINELTMAMNDPRKPYPKLRLASLKKMLKELEDSRG